MIKFPRHEFHLSKWVFSPYQNSAWAYQKKKKKMVKVFEIRVFAAIDIFFNISNGLRKKS